MKKYFEFGQPSGINSFVPLAFVSAVGGVGFEDAVVLQLHFHESFLLTGLHVSIFIINFVAPCSN